MPLRVSPESLRSAAGTLSLLPTEIDRAPHLGAGPPAAKLMSGSAVGTALGTTDPLSKRAKDVLKARFNEFAAVLALSADTFQGTDADAAQRLAALSDINSGDPHGGR
ncbi:hypothetical protein [Nocardia sp. NPDC052566]|uniref:hypothetical protein n=1 Tax=Nocardia sp. NPDC052566 TaxID=3364330 RepID=UPI0037CB4905